MKSKILILSIVILLTGCKINEAIKSANNVLGQVIEPTASEITHTELCNDFSDNEIAAKKKWVGKWVIMSGKITSISSLDSLVRYDVYQPTPPKSVHISFNKDDSAAYTLKPSEESNVLKIKTGQTVKLKGKISDISDNLGCFIMLDDGTIQQ